MAVAAVAAQDMVAVVAQEDFVTFQPLPSLQILSIHSLSVLVAQEQHPLLRLMGATRAPSDIPRLVEVEVAATMVFPRLEDPAADLPTLVLERKGLPVRETEAVLAGAPSRMRAVVAVEREAQA